MKLDYFTLLSPSPITFQNVGGIKSPTLREISIIGYPLYQKFLSLLLLDSQSYSSLLPDSHNLQTENIPFFNLLIKDIPLRNSICNALNFFMTDTVVYNENEEIFFTYNQTVKDKKDQPTGLIHANNYPEITDVILQRVNMKRNDTESKTAKVKNKTAARLLEKMQKVTERNKENNDKITGIANIISSLSCHHNSLNLTNIWDLTIYQLYDQFNRQRLNDCYDIQATHIAAWGNSEGKFDDTQWFSLI